MKQKVLCFFLFCILLLGCAEIPEHTNIFDPDTPNIPPGAVELKPDLIKYITNNSIEFGWTESGDEDFYQYKIYRRSAAIDLGVSPTLIRTIPYPFWNSISDTGLHANTSYYYTVCTEDKGGKINSSNEIQIATSPEIDLVWNEIGFGYMSTWGTYSKMNVITYDNKSYIFMARLLRDWRLDFERLIYSAGGNTEIGAAYLLGGDRDGDGAPDVYELYNSDGDMNNPLVYPPENYRNSPLVAPAQIVAMKEENSTTVHIFVLLYWCCILKFTGDLNSLNYTPDVSWHDNGILKIHASSIAPFSSSQLIVGSNNRLFLYPLNGNPPSDSTDIPSWAGIISLGKDTPAGETFIYTSDPWGYIHKYNTNWNLISSWKATSSAAQNLSCNGFYADDNGNLFIVDPGIGCIIKYDSNGKFISRWYETISWINNMIFSPTQKEYGNISITGDKQGGIFIMDQSPAVFYTQQ